jgi:hypothetical protein
MSTPESEQVLTLLKELSVMKEVEKDTELRPAANSERDAHQVRKQEIAEEIQSLAERKKNKRTISDPA